VVKRKLVERHGMHKTPFYQAWAAMKYRCNNPNEKRYMDYGGRGIFVCNEWNDSFIAFYNDMIESHKIGLQLDRIDNNGNYCKENCRWVTPTINMANRGKLGSLPRGVKKVKNGKFQARLSHSSINYHIGTYNTIEEASIAASVMHKEWYGF